VMLATLLAQLSCAIFSTWDISAWQMASSCMMT
jgi:hypothetical protein